MAIGRTRTDTVQGRWYAFEIPAGGAMMFTGDSQCVERVTAHGAAGSILTLTIPGAGGPQNYTLGAGQALHVFDILGRYELSGNITIACGAGCVAIVELVDLT